MQFRALAKTVWTAGILSIGLAALSPAAEDDPRRPPAIAAEQVPVIPGELFERLRQYQNVRTAAFQSWSPDGRGMLISTRFGNSVQLHRVYEPGGRREQLTFYDEPALGTDIPQAQDGALLVTMSQGGNENFQIYLHDTRNGRSQLLTDGKSKNDLGPIRDDGARMVFGSNRRNGRDTDLYLADCRQPDSAQMLMQNDGEYWVATDWSADGSKVAVLRYVSINESYPAIIDVASRKRDDLPMPVEGKHSFGLMRFAADGRSVYLTTDARDENLELARFDLATRKYEWVAPGLGWDVDAVRVDHARGRVVFTTNFDGGSRLYLLEKEGPRQIELPLGVVGGLEFSPDAKHLGLTLARPNAPADAYSLRLEDQTLTRWTFSEVGGLNPESFVSPERIQFSSFDGRKIPAYYYRPRGASAAKKAPVVIDIHGGPEGQSRPIFSSLAQYLLNEQGIAVIFPNVRGSAGYGKSYLKLDNAQRRLDSVKDIGALLDWIAEQPELDASRVAVQGGSYGGFMVLASLVHFGERIKAGIDIVGIANFITFLERTSPYRQDLRRAEYGDERDPAMRAAFEREINPIAGVDRIQAALFVAHGRNDPRVPFFEAEQIADKVRQRGRPVWTVYADNEGHGFAKKDNRDYLTAAEILFLEEHLKK